MKADKKQNSSRMWAGCALAAFVAAVAIFMVMLQMEKKVLDDYERGAVYVALKEMPKGLVITEENEAEYLQLTQMDVDLIPETAITSPEQLQGLIAKNSVDKGVLLAEGMFEQKNEILRGMHEPVVAGMRAEDLYQVVGGVLRGGDRIHIYTVSESQIAGLIWENIFVEQVFDSGGNVIGTGDKVSAAQRVNVYLEAADVEQFYTELARGTLRVVKVCD